MTTVAVIGAGTMGQGIAQLTAAAGLETRVFDGVDGKAQAAVTAIGAQWDRLVEKGKMSATAREDSRSRILAVGSMAVACENVDFVLEAIPERMDLKVSVLSMALGTAPSHAIVGSNTSSLSITELGARLGEAHRVVGLHFFNPPPVMELLEVVHGLRTAPSTMQTALELARTLGKTPIVVRDTPGFATSRLGVILGAEAIRMLESGVASVTDIDRAMELGYRHPMGPLKLTDLVGLDVRLAILEHLHHELGEQFRPPTLLRTMVRAGRLGKKTGAGFYVWKDGVPMVEGAPNSAASI